MPISVQIDKKQEIVFRVIEGSITIDELIESFTAVLESSTGNKQNVESDSLFNLLFEEIKLRI